jgi:catechol 2,3-dioxygenase-like lactoylglutathione lyase family enzyme
MIDHVSIGVVDLPASTAFYERVLAALGYAKLEARPHTVGFGKKYPEFWLNLRAHMPPVGDDTGTHVCLRAPSTATVDAFHAEALAAGGTSDGAPGLRPHRTGGYYAAFIRDLDGHRVEAVTFVTG